MTLICSFLSKTWWLFAEHMGYIILLLCLKQPCMVVISQEWHTSQGLANGGSQCFEYNSPPPHPGLYWTQSLWWHLGFFNYLGNMSSKINCTSEVCSTLSYHLLWNWTFGMYWMSSVGADNLVIQHWRIVTIMIHKQWYLIYVMKSYFPELYHLKRNKTKTLSSWY